MLTSVAELYVDSRCTLGEGLVWDARRRALLWTDIERSTLWMHGASGSRCWRLPERLGSFALCASGRVLLALASRLCVAELDEATGEDLAVEDLVRLEHKTASGRTNDGRTDRSGNFVFGTYNDEAEGATGGFYQYSAQRGLRRLDLGDITIANSICFAGDGRTMYFCDSPTGVILCCDYDAAAARVSNVREFVRLAPQDGFPDGSIVDADDCLWNAAWSAGRVRRYSPDGRLLCEVHVAAKNTTCPTFGGDDLDELFVTSARQQMSADELELTPGAGGVYRCAAPGARGVADARFEGL
jgi:L-arabinonolactonase